MTQVQKELFPYIHIVGGHPGSVGGHFSFAVFFRVGWGPKCPYEAVVQDKSVGAGGTCSFTFLRLATQQRSFPRIALMVIKSSTEYIVKLCC